MFRTGAAAVAPVAVPPAIIARFWTAILLAVVAAVIARLLLTAGLPVSFAMAAVAATSWIAGAGIVTRGFRHNLRN